MENRKRIFYLAVAGMVLLSIFFNGFFTPLNAENYLDEVVTLIRDRSPVVCAQPAFVGPVLQNYILRQVSNPTGTLVLFTGGGGRLNLDIQDSQNKRYGLNSSTNFLVRSRHLFASFGFNIAVVDAATDFLACNGFLTGRRLWPQHLSDIEAVITDLRTKFPDLPVWVVGTSMGSVSAAQAGTIPLTSPGTPDGIVLTSSVTRPQEIDNVLRVNLESICVPTLIVPNEQDACPNTPPEDVEIIASRLTSAPKIKVIRLSGGFTPISGECDALSYHGFLGIEPKVAARISKWIINQIVK